MLENSSLRRRILTRVGVGIGATAAAILALPGIAQAHVTVQPGSAEGGGFSVVSFRVPNERDNASTTQLRVTLPQDQPIGSVQTTPLPGWKITTKTRQLDKPIEMFGEQLNTVVSEVTWTAIGGGDPSGPVPRLQRQPRPASRVGRVGVQRSADLFQRGEGELESGLG